MTDGHCLVPVSRHLAKPLDFLGINAGPATGGRCGVTAGNPYGFRIKVLAGLLALCSGTVLYRTYYTMVDCTVVLLVFGSPTDSLRWYSRDSKFETV